MASLFISYSRKDKEAAQKLTDAFQGQDLDFWIDWSGIEPTVDWWLAIEKGIEEADTFVFLLSPDSITSKVCGWEIEHAVKNGKRLIPVKVRDINAGEAPAQLRPLNWIALCEADDFEAGFGKLIKAIHTDYAWAQVHRQLQVKALEWQQSQRKTAFLLHGEELRDAEQELATNANKAPRPTDLQREYVLMSRQASDRQRRVTRSIALGVIIVLAGLSIAAIYQAGQATTNARREQAASTLAVSNAFTAQVASTLASGNAATAEANAAEARNQAEIAQANEHAALALANTERQLAPSILLSVDAFHRHNNYQTRGALLDTVRASPHLNQFLFGHAGSTFSAAFHPDKESPVMASGGCGEYISGNICVAGEIIFWDTARRAAIGSPIGAHDGAVFSVAFTPDGKTLASGGLDGTISFWDAASRELLAQMKTKDHDPVSTISFNKDGTILASNGDGNNVILWDVNSHARIGQPLVGHTDTINIVAFSPDGQRVASSSCGMRDEIGICVEGEILLWDVASQQPIGLPFKGHTNTVWGLAFSPDGKTLASGGVDSNIILWDVASGTPIGDPLTGHTDTVFGLAFSPDGKTLVSASWDKTILLWDMDTRQPIGEPLYGNSDSVSSVTFSPKGNLLASTSFDKAVTLWDVTSFPRIAQPLQGHNVVVSDVNFRADGKALTSASWDNNLILWDLANRERVASSQLPEGFSALGFSPDGTLLAGDRNDEVILWDVDKQKEAGEPLRGHAAPVSTVAFSLDGKTIAAGSSDQTIHLWDVQSGQPLGEALEGHTDALYGLAFSPDGKTLASGSSDYSIILWDIASGQSLGEPLRDHTDIVTTVAFSPDGKTLASGSGDSTIILWDVESRQPVGEPLRGHTSSVFHVTFSPDGKTLASSSNDGTVILWDVESGQPIGQPLVGHTAAVFDVAFSPDGEWLASGSFDQSVILWEVNPGSWAKLACDIVGRNFTQLEWRQFFPAEPYRKTCEQWPVGD